MCREGWFFGLVGENGAGKTTLIMHLLGVLKAQTGTVRVFGLDPVREPVGVLARVGLLAALAYRPELLVLDETSTGLDPIVRREI